VGSIRAGFPEKLSQQKCTGETEFMSKEWELAAVRSMQEPLDSEHAALIRDLGQLCKLDNPTPADRRRPMNVQIKSDQLFEKT